MRPPGGFNALRATERQAREKLLSGLGRTSKPDHAAPRELPFVTHSEAHKIARETRIKTLDGLVRTHKINHQERYYEIQRFENGRVQLPRADEIASPAQSQPRPTSRNIGHVNQADMVSQGLLARELLKQKREQDAQSKKPDKDKEVERKPSGIELYKW